MASKREGIGGSDWADVLSLAPYGCRRRLWLERTGHAPDFPPPETGPMKRGKKMEDLVAEEYMERTGQTVKRWTGEFRRASAKRIRESHPWLSLHVDRVIVTPDGYDGPGILECKTVGEFQMGRFRAKGLPYGYVCQLQHYLAGSGYKWGAYAVLSPANWAFERFEIRRDDELIEMLLAEGEDFIRQVSSRVEPGPLEKEDDPRCVKCCFRKTCRGTASAAPVSADDDGRNDDRVVVRNEPLLEDALSEYQDAEMMRSEANALYQQARERLAEILGERTNVSVPGAGVSVYYREQATERIDSKVIRAVIPQVVELLHTIGANDAVSDDVRQRLDELLPPLENYRKRSVSRPLRVVLDMD